MRELKIGTRKRFHDVILKVVKSSSAACYGCWFWELPGRCYFKRKLRRMGECNGKYRKDGSYVIYKAIDTPPRSPMAGKKCRIGGEAD